MFRASRLERFLASPWLWALFLLIGFAVRLRQFVYAHSYWYDEAFLILAVEDRGYAELLGPQPYNLVIPPAFLWMIRGLYEFGGKSEIVLRLPAFSAGVAALIVMIPLARRICGPVHGFWAFAWLAFSRHAISHGCEVRPYTFDLLFAELIVLFAAMLMEDTVRERTRNLAATVLCACGLAGPWFSFPSVFVLAGTSIALLVRCISTGGKRDWLIWFALNMIVGLSGFSLWWFSARHMYYEGMIEHWGHSGWGGFPDWSRPQAIIQWIFWRPCEVGNYGSRELGIVLAVLALVGCSAGVRSAPLTVLVLVAPFLVTIVAALLGKYPLAHRTGLFLLPSLWLMAALGCKALSDWAQRRGRRLLFTCFLLIAWDGFCAVKQILQPEPGIEYREAYEFIHAQRKPGDVIWSQVAVVYQTYYGKDAAVMMDHQLDDAVQLTKRQRVWAVFGDDRADLRSRFEAAGGAPVIQHRVRGLEVLLLDGPRVP